MQFTCICCALYFREIQLHIAETYFQILSFLFIYKSLMWLFDVYNILSTELFISMFLSSTNKKNYKPKQQKPENLMSEPEKS